MHYKLVVTFFLLLWLSALSRASPNNIVICVPEWLYYTEQNGTGLYHELWYKIFTVNNVRVDVIYTPFKRCEQAFANPKITRYDTFVGGYGDKDQVIPQWHIGIDMLSAVYRNGFIDQWNGEKSLAGKRVAWERGYDFDKHGIINVDIQLYEYGQLKPALLMLQRNRIDIILDYPKPLKELTRRLGLSRQITIIPNAITGPKYYMVFSNTEKGHILANLWDTGMEKLHKSGELQKLYAKFEDEAY